MGQHTHGPWEVIDGDSHDFSVSHDGYCEGAYEGLVASGYVVLGNVDDPAIAIVVCDMNHQNTWDDDTLDANVALVSAAPDLLAALEWLHYGKGSGVDVAAAIAKARGLDMSAVVA